MRVTVSTIAVLVGLLGLPASIAGEITVFLVRQNVDQNLRQDDVVKPNTTVQTRDGGLVVLVESETVTRSTKDRSGQECLYWTVIPANTTHRAKSSAGLGCGNDTAALDRILASAESGAGRIAKAAFRVVHPPALGRGDQGASESEKAAYRLAASLREIPLDPPRPKGPGAPGSRAQAEALASALALEMVLAAPKAPLENERAAEASEATKKDEEASARRAREQEMRRRRGEKAAEPSGNDGTPEKPFNADTASSKVKAWVAMAVIKGTSVADLSKRTGLPAGTIEEWHTRFVEGGQAVLEGAVSGECGEAIAELRERLGEMVVENGRLRDRCG